MPSRSGADQLNAPGRTLGSGAGGHLHRVLVPGLLAIRRAPYTMKELFIHLLVWSVVFMVVVAALVYAALLFLEAMR
jgi:hypothetical protein